MKYNKTYLDDRQTCLHIDDEFVEIIDEANGDHIILDMDEAKKLYEELKLLFY